MRRLLKSVVPKRVRAALADLRALTPPQRLHYLRSQLSPGLHCALPPGVNAGSRMVFVCHGNIFRSPMAEVLVAAELERLGVPRDGVSSAGLFATDGREAHANGVEVARAMGLSLDAHRARRLTAEVVEASDLIVLMDRLNIAVYRDRFPAARAKAVLMGAFAPDARSGAIIDDPYGRPYEEVVACYARLQLAARELARQLVTAR